MASSNSYRKSPAMTSKAADTESSVPLGLVPIKTIMRRPRLILKPEHLTSKKGILALPEFISECRFKGKDHELSDLRLLLSKSKHWAHRLFPTMTFEDFVDKTEQLGSKASVKNFMTKLRNGMPLHFGGGETIHSDGDSDDEVVRQTVDDEVRPSTSAAKDSELEFDRLFKEHIDETAKTQEIGTNNNDDEEDIEPPTSTIPKPKHQQPSVDDFVMDDYDDFDFDAFQL